MTQLLAVAAVATAAIVVALVADRWRRKRQPPPTGFEGHVPARVPLDALREALAEPLGDDASPAVTGDAGTSSVAAVVVFTEATCASCASALNAARQVVGDAHPVLEVPYNTQRALHTQLGIDAVPTTVVVDDAGDVRAGFVGRFVPAELAAALRSPG